MERIELANLWEAPTTPEQRKLQSDIASASETMHDKWSARELAINEEEAAQGALRTVHQKYLEAEATYRSACDAVSILRRKYEAL